LLPPRKTVLPSSLTATEISVSCSMRMSEVQVAPKSVDVQISPAKLTTVTYCPLLLQEMSLQSAVPGPDAVVHELPPSEETPMVLLVEAA
jgi:hypothetical protein